MKALGILTMILGVLSTLSVTFFTAIHNQYNPLLIISFGALLLGFELFFAWVWVYSKTPQLERSQRLMLATLLVLTLAWVAIVLINPGSRPIFIWALKALNYSGLYFVGLVIYYRETKLSNKNSE